MKHGITEEEWNDYLEGLADEATRDRLEAHLIGCLDCWEFYEQMAHATGNLRIAGKRLRAELVLSDRQLHAGFERVFAKLNNSETNGPGLSREPLPHQPIQQKLDALAALLAPMCGPRTALKALRTAANDSPARSLEQVTAENWTPFLANLTFIANVMCGETGAHLVWESGQW
ncbi:MAG TPA: zf-HC2 domain-containing protein [Pyrinomonadaceae bacterium]|nr:zf-HC2 domain-containing protein [Pyrinomonadaceae bacterium]